MDEDGNISELGADELNAVDSIGNESPDEEDEDEEEEVDEDEEEEEEGEEEDEEPDDTGPFDEQKQDVEVITANFNGLPRQLILDGGIHNLHGSLVDFLTASSGQYITVDLVDFHGMAEGMLCLVICRMCNGNTSTLSPGSNVHSSHPHR